MRVAHKNGYNIAQRIKKEECFTSPLNEYINAYFDKYENDANDFVPETMKRFKYLHNIFDEDGKRHNRSSVQDKVSDDLEANRIDKEKYSTIGQQNSIRQELLGFHLWETMDSDSCASSEALEIIQDRNSTYTPQWPETQRSLEQNVEYRYNALLGTDWLKPVLMTSFFA